MKCKTHLIYEICGLERPALRHLCFPDLRLLRENCVSNFPPALALIRPSAVHAFPSDDSDCKVVGSDSVAVLAHDFGRHVARRAACFVGVVDAWEPFSGDAKIR